jgi:hypothetical protein
VFSEAEFFAGLIHIIFHLHCLEGAVRQMVSCEKTRLKNAISPMGKIASQKQHLKKN